MGCWRYFSLFAVAVAVLWGTQTAQACPECKAAAGGLEEQDLVSQSDDATTNPTRRARFELAIGADFATAYYYHGYLQQNQGVIFQPYITAAYNLIDERDLSVRPYVGWWNSIQSDATTGTTGGHSAGTHTVSTLVPYLDPGHAGDPNPHYHYQLVESQAANDSAGWYETDIFGGVTVNRRDLAIDFTYHAHLFPEGTHDSVQELGGKISYDLAGFWDAHPSSRRELSVKPFLVVLGELDDDNGEENVFMEVGVEPIWRTRVFGQRLAVTLPISLAGSPDGYYTNADGSDAALGYWSVGLKTTLALPMPKGWGNWYLNGSVYYLDFLADGLQEANAGEQDTVYGTLGVAVAF